MFTAEPDGENSEHQSIFGNVMGKIRVSCLLTRGRGCIAEQSVSKVTEFKTREITTNTTSSAGP